MELCAHRNEIYQARTVWQDNPLLWVFGLFVGFVDNEKKNHFLVLSFKEQVMVVNDSSCYWD